MTDYAKRSFMKALFVHDHHFIRLDGEVFSESQFPAALWKRYLEHFDALTVLSRKGTLPQGKQKQELELTSAPNVSFTYGPCLSSPKAQLLKRRKAQVVLRELLTGVDAVIARVPSELGLMAAGEARRAGIPWAVEVSGCPWYGLRSYGTWEGKAYAPLMAMRLRRVVARAPFVLYVTREFLQRRYPNLKGHIAACSNVEMPEPSEKVLRRRLERVGKQPETLVLGLIGSLVTRVKGIQIVFEALACVRSRLPVVEFRILGNGDAQSWKVEAGKYGVADIVRFNGTLPAGEPVLNWLDKVDVYLQPSLTEGLPRAVIEAMSRGCPAIGSRRGGIPELLAAECLIRPGDAKHLGELILRAAESANWRREQAARNWENAKEYSHERLSIRRREFWSHFASYAASRRRDKQLA